MYAQSHLPPDVISAIPGSGVPTVRSERKIVDGVFDYVNLKFDDEAVTELRISHALRVRGISMCHRDAVAERAPGRLRKDVEIVRGKFVRVGTRIDKRSRNKRIFTPTRDDNLSRLEMRIYAKVTEAFGEPDKDGEYFTKYVSEDVVLAKLNITHDALLDALDNMQLYNLLVEEDHIGYYEGMKGANNIGRMFYDVRHYEPGTVPTL